MGSRTNGYYWVQRLGRWQVAQHHQGGWWLVGVPRRLEDSDLDLIGALVERHEDLPDTQS